LTIFVIIDDFSTEWDRQSTIRVIYRRVLGWGFLFFSFSFWYSRIILIEIIMLKIISMGIEKELWAFKKSC